MDTGATLHYHSPQDWHSSIGGLIGEEFKKSLSSEEALASFTKLNSVYAQELEYSYEIYFKTYHPVLGLALLKYLTKEERDTFQNSYARPDKGQELIL